MSVINKKRYHATKQKNKWNGDGKIEKWWDIAFFSFLDNKSLKLSRAR